MESSLAICRAVLAYILWRNRDLTSQGNLKRTILAAVPLSTLLTFLSAAKGGARHKFWKTILGLTWTEKYEVGGYVAPGFEPVKVAFEANFKAGKEKGAQFCAYFRGEKVVDLYGSMTDQLGYNEESIQICFSCSKVLASLVVAMQVDKGLIDYDEKVCTYWPEFGQNGKENLTVSDVLRHESGLAYFESDKIEQEMMKRRNFSDMADFIARQKPVWLHRDDFNISERMYHGQTRGFILNEIVRRVSGRSIGQILREDVEVHSKERRLVLGEPTVEDKKYIFPIELDDLKFTAATVIMETILGETKEHKKKQGEALIDKNSHLIKWTSAMKIGKDTLDWNISENQDLEVPSVNMFSNARSLACVANDILRMKPHLISNRTFNLSHSEPVRKYDHGTYTTTTFNKGGWCMFDGDQWPEVSKGFVGWGGYGGSQMAWNPALDLAIAYTMNGPYRVSSMGFHDERCISLMEALVPLAKTKLQLWRVSKPIVEEVPNIF